MAEQLLCGCCSFSKEELEVIDGEGRCLLTDHGDFVLGNIYAPAMTSEENAEDRFQYRMQFYKVCQSLLCHTPCLWPLRLLAEQDESGNACYAPKLKCLAALQAG